MISSFKYVIREFHEMQFPKIYARELELPKTDQVITLYGSRRSGKTFYFYFQIITLMKLGIPLDQIVYINFEDDRLFPLDVKNLQYIMDAYYELYPDNVNKQKYFFLDEIQNIEKWELFIRRIQDKEKIKIFITGSSSKLLSSEIATSLRGRTLSYQFFPLSFREFISFNGISLNNTSEFSNVRYQIKNLLIRYINGGGFPELSRSVETRREILSAYYNSMIFKDVVERFSVRNVSLLRNLTQFLMTNIANHFSLNSYYRNIKSSQSVSLNTIAEYFSYLNEINLFFQVKYFSYSLKSQQSRPVKIYCIDTGLRNAVAFKFSKDEGRLVENIVFLQLKRKGLDLYYWSDKQNEVDFVYKDIEDKLHAINVTFGRGKIPEREVKGLQSIKQKLNIMSLLLINTDYDNFIDGIEYISLWKWLIRN